MAHDRRPPRTVRRNIKAVAAGALAAVDLVLAHWLAGGKREGVEYVALNPKRADSKPGSFKVNTASGAWSDFATGDKGGDLVALVAYLEACSQPDAADRLARFLGMPDPDSTPPRTPPPARPASAPAPADSIVMPVPADTPPRPVADPKHGKPAATWTYRDSTGAVLFYIRRFNLPDGDKVIKPLSIWRGTAGLFWQAKAPPAPRPLYGLDRLAARPDVPVLVTEGEKAADAAARLLPGFAVITSPGGSKAAGKADWSALRGRQVLIWSDADAPGAAYAEDVARLALAAGTRAVRVLNLAALETLRGESLPPGYDAHDAMTDGLDPAELARVAMDPANWTERGEPAPTKSPTLPTVGERFLLIASGNADGMRPGIYYVPTARNRQTGEWIDGAPQWICSPLSVEAHTRNADGEDWGRLLVFVDRDGHRRLWAMPMTMLARNGDELREELLRLGLEITTDGNLRRKLCEFIQQADPGTFARCVDRTGWHGSGPELRFVLSDRTIGPSDGERVLFQSMAPTGAKVAQGGTLADWQRVVSIPCAGNSRLVLALCMGFAAPCLGLVGADGGGIHLRGPSSVGKSTALALAASVYGPPAYRREWRQTDNGLEAVACMHSDMLLILDEIGTLEPRFAASVAYLLANGQGKARARRDGTLREPARWCLLFLSCGEEGLHDLLCRAGEQSRAGMEVRIVDLPADAGAGLGLFDRVPAGQSPGEFAETLRAAAARFYGVAFVTFLEHIIGPSGGIGYARGMLKHYSDKALEAFGIAPTATGQVRRVAQRFALIAAGGELATTYGVTGWTEGEATRAAARCFRDWLDTRGTDGPTEPVRMIAQVRAFIEQHGESRFASGKRANDDRAPRTMLRAGWTVECPDGSLDYLVFRETFRAEVCKGFDHRQVAAVLAERGALETEGSGDRRTGYTRKERLPDGIRARVYRIKAAIWTAEA